MVHDLHDTKPAMAVEHREQLNEKSLPSSTNGDTADVAPAAEELTGKYGTTAEDDDDVRLTFRTFMVLFAISLLSMAVGVAIIGPATVSTYVILALGDPTNISWIAVGSSAMQATVSLPLAFTTDLYGRRWMLIFTSALGVAGTFVSGTANSTSVVIAGQCLTGICLATKPLCYAIGSEVLPRKHRGSIQLWITFLSLAGSIVGAVGGPALISNNPTQGWRHFYYLEGAIFGVAMLSILFFYRPPPRPTHEAQSLTSLTQKLLRLDLLGMALQAGGFVMLLVGLNWGGGGRYAWSSPHVLGMLITGLGLLAVFCIYEWKFTTDGLVPHALFRERNFVLSCVVIFAEGVTYFAFATEYPAEVLKLYTTSPLDQGLRNMAFPLAGMISTPLWIAFVHKYKLLKLPLVVGFALFLVATIMMIFLKTTTSTMSVVAHAIGGAAFSSPLAFLVVTVQLATPPKYIGVASAWLAVARAIGVSCSIPIYASIRNPYVRNHLPAYVRTAAVAAGLPAASATAAVTATTAGVAKAFSPAQLQAIPGMTPQIIAACFAAARRTYEEAYHREWIVAACFAAVCLLLMIPFTDPRAQLNSQIDAPAEDVHAHRNKETPA